MKIFIAGIGPGDPELITLSALDAARDSDFVLIPRSHDATPGIAERVVARHLPDKKFIRITFPMISDPQRRSEIISEQLAKLETELRSSKKIFFPVIGDSMLYSTGAYLIDELRKIIPDLEVEFIPGISAHSLAGARVQSFMAMSEDIFSVIPGTADPARIIEAVKASDASAIYKPIAMRDKGLRDFIRDSCKRIIRVDFAGIPDKEKIFYGSEALEDIDEYISIILLWKN